MSGQTSETTPAHDAIEETGTQEGSLPAVRLNSSCFCSSLDRSALQHALVDELGGQDLFALVEQRCPYLFSARPVFISESQALRIEALVRAVESVVALPAYRQRVLERAPEIARRDPGGARGIFLGYDFHPRAGGRCAPSPSSTAHRPNSTCIPSSCCSSACSPAPASMRSLPTRRSSRSATAPCGWTSCASTSCITG